MSLPFAVLRSHTSLVNCVTWLIRLAMNRCHHIVSQRDRRLLSIRRIRHRARDKRCAAIKLLVANRHREVRQRRIDGIQILIKGQRDHLAVGIPCSGDPIGGCIRQVTGRSHPQLGELRHLVAHQHHPDHCRYKVHTRTQSAAIGATTSSVSVITNCSAFVASVTVLVINVAPLWLDRNRHREVRQRWISGMQILIKVSVITFPFASTDAPVIPSVAAFAVLEPLTSTTLVNCVTWLPAASSRSLPLYVIHNDPRQSVPPHHPQA